MAVRLMPTLELPSVQPFPASSDAASSGFGAMLAALGLQGTGAPGLVLPESFRALMIAAGDPEEDDDDDIDDDDLDDEDDEDDDEDEDEDDEEFDDDEDGDVEEEDEEG